MNMKSFEELNLSNELLASIKKLGFTTPTEIQARSIPSIIEGKDVVGESATGSGKTLAFGCGVFQYVLPKKGIQALILTPTRELAEQVKRSLKDISRQLNVIAIYGGVSMNPQIDGARIADVVVATPGRLLDHMRQRTINLSNVKLLVLDEVDRMLDMGFIDDVEKIIQNCPKQRQNLFFSATISSQISDLIHRYMKNPIKVFVTKHVDANKLKQVFYDVSNNLKLSLLIHLLKQEKSGLVMVFCNSRRSTDIVAKNLQKNGISAMAIHGGLSQNKRLKSIDLFNNAKVGVLICTDVASRGLHIDNISHVYNYEIPRDPKDYVHRIGRTARAGQSGKVVNLLSNHDHDNFSRVLRDNAIEVKKEETPYVERVIISDRPKHFGHRQHFGRRDWSKRR